MAKKTKQPAPELDPVAERAEYELQLHILASAGFTEGDAEFLEAL